MKNVPAPRRRAILDYDDVVARKHAGPEKTWLQDSRADISRRYRHYQRHNDRLETLPAAVWPAVGITALQSCYDNSDAFDATLLRRTFPNHRNETPICPYCQVDHARTWDHFLPYTRFPEFSIYPHNLIRACDDCNRRKNRFGVTPPRRVFNPYYDNLGGVRYLSCRISALGGQLIAGYLVDPDTAHPHYSPAIHTILREHFVLFELEDKLRAQSTPDITGFLESARLFGPPTVARIRQVLREWIAQARAKRLDVNDREWLWRDALLNFPSLARHL